MAVIFFLAILFVSAIAQPSSTPSASLSAANRAASRQGLLEPHPMTSHPRPDIMPALSPDGRWLAYVSHGNNNYDIWAKPAAGGQTFPLTTHTSDDFSPAWSPDGKVLVFISRRDDAEGDLFLMKVREREGRLEPGKVTRLTGNFMRETTPAFSPDGKIIAFSRGPSGHERIWFYHLNSKNAHPFKNIKGTHPAWSPDGKHLAIIAPVAGHSGKQLFIFTADTSIGEPARQITFIGDNNFPSWSPQGDMIVLQRAEINKGKAGDHLRLIQIFDDAGRPLIAPRELQITPMHEGALFPCWGRNRAIYYAADHYGNLDLWRIPESGMLARFASPQQSIAFARNFSDAEIAILTLNAIPFDFPDSTLAIRRAELELGRRFLAQGDTLEALAIWSVLAQEDNRRFETAALAKVELAATQRNTRQLEEILQHKPSWPQAQALGRLALGKILREQGRREAALNHFLNLPDQYPEQIDYCHEALLHAGEVLAEMRRLSAAEEAYLKIAALNPERLDWRQEAIERLLNLGLSHSAGDTLAAYQLLIQKYADRPDANLYARFRLARQLAAEGERQLATNEYHGLLKLLEPQTDPFFQILADRAALALIRLHLADNELPGAIQIFDQMNKRGRAASDQSAFQLARSEVMAAMLQRGRFLLRQRDAALALALFQQAREYNAKEIEAHRGYLEAMFVLERIDEAVAEYQNLSASDPGNEAALYALGLAYSYKGTTNIDLLRQSCTLIERSLAINYRLVPAYLTLGFNYEAIEKLEQKERKRQKGFFEKIALATPRLLDNFRRALTLQKPRQPERWYEKAIEVLTLGIAVNDERVAPLTEANLALNLANNYYNLGEFAYPNAYHYYLIKFKYDSSFTNLEQKAIIFERAGQCAWASGNSREAVALLQEAVRLCQSLRDADGELRNLNRLALLYEGLGDYESSNEYYGAVLAAGKRESRDQNQAIVLRNLAQNYQKNEELEEAIQKSDSSFKLLVKHGASGFPKPKKSKFEIKLLGLPVFWQTADQFGESSGEGLTYDQEQALIFSIIGESHEARKELSEAVTIYERKVANARKRKDHIAEAIALNKLGHLWYSHHQFTKAYAYFENSYEVCQRNKIAPGKVANLINMGAIAMLPQPSPRQADSLTLMIERLAQNTRADIEEIAVSEPRQKLAVLNLLGTLHYNAALRHFSEVAPASPTSASNGQEMPALTQNLKTTLQALQSLSQARAALDTCLTLAISKRLFAEEVIVRRNLAGLFMLAHDYAPALEHLQIAHEISIQKNLAELTWRVEHAIGTLAQMWRLPEEHPWALKTAWQWYAGAIAILEGLPIDPVGIEQRLSEKQEERELYENAIIWLTDHGAFDEALALSERRRAKLFANLSATRYLLPKLESQRVLWGGGGGEVTFLQGEISKARSELRKLEREEPQRPKELARVRAELAKAESQYRQIVADALEEDPQLASFFSAPPVDLPAVQGLLDENTAALSYFVGEHETVVWRLTPEEIVATRLAISRRQLRERVMQFRDSLIKPESGSAAWATELGGLLLGSIPELEAYARLIIVPDDCLHYLPFGALRYQGEYAIDLFGFTKTPSLAALDFAERNKNLNTQNVLVLQDAAQPGVEQLALCSSPQPMQMIQGGDWRSSGMRQRLAAAGILHIDHQLLAQPENPLSSSFRLQLTKGAGAPPETALFPLYRLFELNLTASAVVLSNTAFAYHAEQTGEELIALQRSLIYSGAPSIILTQWRITPEERTAFCRAFYENFKDQPALDALSAAQAHVRERFPQSSAWAAFELTGYMGMTDAEKMQFASARFDFTVAKGTKSRDEGQFGDAVRYYQSALTMAQQLGRQDYVKLLEERIKVSAVEGKNFALACELEEKILQQALAENNIGQASRSYRNLSIWRRELQAYEAAIEAEKKNLALLEQANNAMALASSQFELAKIEQARRNYDAALAWAEQAAAILRQQNQPLARLLVETLLGKIAIEADRYGQALAYLENALTAFHAGLSAASTQEKSALAVARQFAAIAYTRLSAYSEAIPLLENAVATFTALNDTANLAQATQALAETFWLNGDYQNALVQQQRALAFFAALGDQALGIRGHTTRGLILLSLGELVQALDVQKQALQLALAWEEEKPVEARREQATVYKNLGLVYLQQKQFHQARASFALARDIDQQLGAARGLLYDYYNLGQAYQALGQIDSAQHYINAAEALAPELGDQRVYVKALYTKGLLFAGRGNKTQARAALQHALAKADEIKQDELQWRCLWQLARLAQQANDLPAAWDFYERATAGIERQSARIKVEEYRSGFIDNKTDIYEEAVLLLLQMKRESEALQFAERAKSRSFADLLASGNVDWQAGADRELLTRQNRLRDQISFTQGKISALQQKPSLAESDRFAIQALQDSLAGLRAAYAELLAEIKAAHPELADLVNVEPLPIPELQALLPDSVALVEYFFAKNLLVSWVADRRQVRAVTMPLERVSLGDLILQFRKAIEKRASVESFGRQLYDQLIAPIAPMLQNAKQLVIVPHGVLHYLPFAALQKADSTYLIDDHALALAPSATVLGFCYRKGQAMLGERRQNLRILALGNPDVGNPQYDLPFAEKEIESLQFTFGEIESYTRIDATQQSLAAGASRANLVHLSCHGVYDERNPLFSALLLAPDSTDNTGRLEAHEIFGLKLNTYLVMLSACETGLAKVTGGDEVIGLSRSFIFAGTPALIASLWQVDDLATAITVKRFYRYLKAGASKAEALRQAQRFVRDYRNRHPAYWASFGLTGDWR